MSLDYGLFEARSLTAGMASEEEYNGQAFEETPFGSYSSQPARSTLSVTAVHMVPE